ncbi:MULTISPECIES: pyridoxal-phosphate dependent enzyme [Aminobacter]|jgi:L-serine/L-threonine ammonia-lyase|uniref:L-serine ammonia-lyase n=1 Tax=Aminobacter ciceronei TaxID=150723 RepID=A0ABR6BZX2_9HYPH|nr:MULTISPECIES: pyridoxal-phosphate dependent enzyme [Aminobacter]WMC95469.1 pyridoxal-phosphate dependent enzyme [Aminobacter aminovorans]MBA8904478.1 L-serine/L-threonine ammonia-lyase [Aminobacter ciceronei]MBA9018256.1 L-serine/L-threonine ammonia-lyase [Aminobacter ciceronei]MRX33090.1 pyridoxal-phosphate dependent enzyme [Aminobacter sp. MDW-2]QNH36721.1 pyridoxal-phosphate dependent enzyme [Aminobacter sp. MDW-2]
MPLHINTPLLESRPLSLAAGRSIWLKMDALQPPGSFKIRGIGAACEHHAKAGKRRFVSSSGGNAGIAVAYAGRRLGMPVSVFVPETATELAKALIRQEGAEVIVHGASWQEANERAMSALDADTAFIHPFDDPLLWTGHATMIDEVVAEGLSFDAVALSVGGGGLMSGIVEGLARNSLAHIPIIAVETEGAASLAVAMEAGQRVQLPAITSIATSLGARIVSERAFEVTQTQSVDSVVVSDHAAVEACLRFLDDHRVLVEPACGATLALAYSHMDALSRYNRVLMIACGGATASLAQLQAWHTA